MDTRKTTPLIRFLEKEAVRIGGGYNHRMGLYDMIMLKDNHIDFAGGIAKAILQTNQYLKIKKLDLKIEVETRDLKEVKEVLKVESSSYHVSNFGADLTTAVRTLKENMKQKLQVELI